MATPIDSKPTSYIKDDIAADEEMNAGNGTHSNENSSLIQDNNSGREIPLCGCLSVQFYKPYFDVDTAEVLSRISHSLIYCGRSENFLALINDKPDAYGPIWIPTTLVFTVALTSHINSWLIHWMTSKSWQYDFESIVTASTVIYSFASGAPAAIWFVLGQFGVTTRIADIVCLYGYSMFVFIPATLVCLLPSDAVSWIALLIAAASSSIFLLRNLAPVIIGSARQHAVLLLCVTGCIQIVLGLILKLCFFYRT